MENHTTVLIWSNVILRPGLTFTMNLFTMNLITLFVDCSAFIDRETGRKHAGFGIVSVDRTLLIEQPLPEQAELLALTETCTVY